MIPLPHPAESFSRDDLAKLLAATTDDECSALYAAAYRVKKEHVGAIVRLRGLIEISNICSKNCLYCGIRSANRGVHRYTLSQAEILELASRAMDFHYGSIVLQSGERSDPAWIDCIEDTIRRIKALSNNALGITLSLGEQTPDTYRRWFHAGAHRYLLRIETSSPKLYASLHPANHSWHDRAACLNHLADAGYQVGTGVMCGLPGQTLHDLADDLLFFRDHAIDMIGMGPWLPHSDTPLNHPGFNPRDALRLGLNMIAVARLLLRDVNIASTTALQALAPDGRERGLLAGANVIMPNLSPLSHRADYTLYDDKPGLDESDDTTRRNLEAAIRRIGETLSPDAWGDSPHFAARTR